MVSYLVVRLGQAALVLLGITLLTFLLTFAVPADPARMIAGQSATADTVQRIRHELGLDQPLPVQFWRYLRQVTRGDLGRSYAQKVEVAVLLRSRFRATVELMAAGIVFELLIGLPAGILAALRLDTWVDRGVMVGAFLGVSAPQFAVGLLLIYLVAFRLDLLPLGGYGSLGHLLLPALTLGIAGGGWYARVMRSALVEVLAQDYVRTARAKGLRPAQVVGKHALKNAVLPIVTMIGLDFGTFMGGVVVVESVFGWPGIGQLAWQAIQIVDIPVIMGVVIFSALAIVAGNLLADIAYPLLNPKIRYQ